MGDFYKIQESLDLFSKALGKEKDVNSRASVGFFVEKRGDASSTVTGKGEGMTGDQVRSYFDGRRWNEFSPGLQV